MTDRMRLEWIHFGIAIVMTAVFAESGRAAGPVVSDLAIPGRTNAQPSLAAQGSFVAVSWAASIGGATDVYVGISRDGGHTFGKPVRVNDATARASVSGEQPPRVALVPQTGQTPTVVVVWTAKGSAGTRLLWARSDDGGASFGAGRTVPGSEGRGNRGWESIAVDSTGRVVVIWLDHRDHTSGSSSGAMDHDGQGHSSDSNADGASRAQGSKLYVAKLGDNDARAIASGVCYCCKTSVVAGADGSIYATWRHVYPGNIRDIAFTMSRDAGRTFATPIRVSSDQWVLNGCPENGPAMALGAVNTVHVVWPTLVNASGGEPTLELFYAATQDGRRFSARQRIPTSGTPRHPQVASAPDGSLLAVWDEQIDGTRRVAVAKGVEVATDRIGFTRVPVDERLRAEYPVVATMAGGYVVAWASGQGQQSTIRVQRFDD